MRIYEQNVRCVRLNKNLELNGYAMA
jgi:hypothetical protein